MAERPLEVFGDLMLGFFILSLSLISAFVFASFCLMVCLLIWIARKICFLWRLWILLFFMWLTVKLL